MVRGPVQACLVGILCVLCSCTLAKVSGRGSKPLYLNNPPQAVDVVGRLQESEMVTFDYTSSFDISEIVAEALGKAQADAVTNIVVVVKSDAGTFFVNLFTLGIAAARRMEVSGDLVKFK